MRITGVNTFSLQKALGLDEACRLIKEAGFQGMDANLDILFAHDDIMNRRTNPIFDLPEEECIKHFLPWKETAEKYGLTIYQAHCAFPGYFHRCGAYNDYLFSMLEKSVAGCGAIGCSKLIIHPFYNGYEHSLAPEEDFEVNFNRYAALIPAAKKHHVMICLENMFLAFRGKIYSGVCSEMEETCRLVDALNEKAGEKCFGFCLDTGHLLVLGRDVKQAMRYASACGAITTTRRGSMPSLPDAQEVEQFLNEHKEV